MARSLRNTVVFGPILQLMFLVTASRVELPLEVFYILLMAILGLQVYFFERDNPGQRVIDTRQYSIGQAPLQVLAGIGIGLGLSWPALLFGRADFHPGLASEFVTQAIFVSFVETVYLIVNVETLFLRDFPLGPVIWPLIFGVLHIREQLQAGDVSLATFLRFAYAAAFGALFWALYAARAHLPKRVSRFFGAVTSWTAHLVVNMIVLAFPLTLLGMELFPLILLVLGGR